MGESELIIKWTKKNYTLRDFLKKFDLPQIVKFTSGWCGHDEHETISGGQVMRIARKFSQQRVIATDELGRHLSIPRNYDFKFNILSSKTERDTVYTIEEILEKFTLPQTIRLAEDEELDVVIEDRTKGNLGTLTMKECHTITYLAGNSMRKNSIIPQPNILPLYIPVEITVAEGLVNGTKKQWEEFKQTRTSIVERDVFFNPVVGNEDISIYDKLDVETTRKKSRANKDDEENVYSVIEPSLIARLRSIKPGNRGVATQPEEHTAPIVNKGSKIKRSSSIGYPPPYAALVDEIRHNYEVPQQQRVSQDEISGEHYEDIDVVRPPPHHTQATPEVTETQPVEEQKSPASGADTEQQRPPPLVPRPPSNVPKTKPPPPPKPPRPVSVIRPTVSPIRLEDLSVQGVSGHLKSLKLDKHIDMFKEQMIDGQLLCELTKDIMINDLGFTSIEALRLSKSLTGWRPKTDDSP